MTGLWLPLDVRLTVTILQKDISIRDWLYNDILYL